MSAATRTLLRGAIGRVRDRLASRAATLPLGTVAGRARSIHELRPEVAALALAGVSTFEIARRTGLAHDAIGLILYLGHGSREQAPAARGTVFRGETRRLAGGIGA